MREAAMQPNRCLLSGRDPGSAHHRARPSSLVLDLSIAFEHEHEGRRRGRATVLAGAKWRLAALSLLVFLALDAQAQRQPHIGYVFPAGGQQGSSFEVVVGGQYLATAKEVFVSGDGVLVEFVAYERPVRQKEINNAREKLKDVRKQIETARKEGQIKNPAEAMGMFLKLAKEKGYSVEDLERLAEFRRRRNDPKRQLNPQISENVVVRVTVAPDAKPGVRELRLGARSGLSNPMAFCVGHLREYQEPEQEFAFTWQQLGGLRGGNVKRKQSADSTRRVTLPTVINGQILPGEVDHYRFTARKGQQLVAVISARELIPYLADAVPGWFQATVALYDTQGNEVAYEDDFQFHPDPVLCYKIPKDGEYTIAIQDAIYRGREDFVYRISLGEVPFVTSIFPLGGPAGQPTRVELNGWNLAKSTLTIGESMEPGVHPVFVRTEKEDSNHLLFAVDRLPECREVEPNNRRSTAQEVKLPIHVDGRIEWVGDRDVYRFEGRADDGIVLEVTARRLNSPLDSVLKLTDAKGKQIAFNDDYMDRGSGLTTHHADSYLSARLPADGAYYVELGDARNHGGSAFGYRLRLSPPRPDFELRLVPSSIIVRPGMTVPVTVHAVRKDGFTGEIALALKNAPEGFVLGGNWVPAGQDQVRITLTAPARILKEPVNLKLEGRASVSSREIVRPVVPAEDMMQAFFYRHLVPTEELKVAVRGPVRRRAPVTVLGDSPAAIPVGDTACIRISAPIRRFAGEIELELDNPPEGIAIQDVSTDRTTTEITVSSEAGKVEPGLRGNLIVTAYGRPAPKPHKPNEKPKRWTIGTLPAIPFEVVAQK